MQQPYYSGLKAIYKCEPQHNPAICPFTVPKVLSVVSKCSWLTIFSYLIQLAHLPISRPIRRIMIFLLGILEKNNDECILILVIY